VIESKIIPCERCGTVVAMLIFAPNATDPGRFEDYARKMYPQYLDPLLAKRQALLRRLYRRALSRKTIRLQAPKPGRNERCPCGSGKKYKKCCGA
jgi:SEC-C motif